MAGVGRALQNMLAGLIDYAGLFPPAALELEPAIRNYAAYRRGAHSWILSRFICPVSRLEDLSPLVSELFDADEPLTLSLILPPFKRGRDLLEAAPELAERLAAYEKTHHGRVRIEALELKLPHDLSQASDPDLIAEHLHRLHSALSESKIETEAFIESSVAQDRAAELVALVDALRAFNDAKPRRPRWGLKIRCGGVTADAFPRSGDLAAAVSLCRDRRVPFKATAGLHHPTPRLDQTVNARTQGFLNLFGGALIARELGLSAEQMHEILDDDDLGGFTFEDTEMRWRGRSVDDEAIAAGRRELATSFGSCSFEEPLDDLHELGLLPTRE